MRWTAQTGGQFCLDREPTTDGRFSKPRKRPKPKRVISLSVFFETPSNNAIVVLCVLDLSVDPRTCLEVAATGYSWRNKEDDMLAELGESSPVIVLMPLIKMKVTKGNRTWSGPPNFPSE